MLPGSPLGFFTGKQLTSAVTVITRFALSSKEADVTPSVTQLTSKSLFSQLIRP